MTFVFICCAIKKKLGFVFSMKMNESGFSMPAVDSGVVDHTTVPDPRIPRAQST
jgi:uncharacterized protein (DUF2236 family)